MVRLSPTQHDPDVEDRTLNMKYKLWLSYEDQNCYLFKSSETLCDPSFRPCFPLCLILKFLASILETEFLIPLLVNYCTRLERLYSRGHYLCDHPDLGSVLHRVWQEAGAGPHVVDILHDGHRLCQGQV